MAYPFGYAMPSFSPEESDASDLRFLDSLFHFEKVFYHSE